MPQIPGMLMVALAVIVVVVFKWINVLNEYERAVVFRLGRLVERPKGPGLILVFWPLDRIVRISLRTVVLDVPPQDVITRDNVSVKVNAVVYFRVVDPSDAVVKVENYVAATSMFSQTTLRSVIGQVELDELLSQRDEVNQRIQTIIDQHTEPWGVKVTATEVRDVVLPEGMKRAMARQAETERERRAKVINAEGEYQASEKLAQAAAVIATQPVAIQLRYLQALTEVAAEQNSTTVFPIPIDLFAPFIQAMQRAAEKPAAPAEEPASQP